MAQRERKRRQEQAAQENSGPRRRWLLAIPIIVGTLAAYQPAMRAGFIWDDDQYALRMEELHTWEGLQRLWFEVGTTVQYYPLAYTTHWLEYHAWGLEPIGYHVVNILCHALVAVLMWRVLRALRVPGAWLAALVFAVHPVEVESVAWVMERKNLLSAALVLGALLLFIRYRPALAGGGNQRQSHWYFAASLGLFVCALLSKTVACSLPAVLLLLLWWKVGRLTKADWWSLLPFFAVGLGLAMVTLGLEKTRVGAVGEEWDLSFIERLLIAGRALWFYLGKLLWPHPLMMIYPRWEIDAGSVVQYLYPATVLASVGALWCLRGRIGRGPLVAVLTFGGTLLPALGFFDVYPMRYSFVSDHFQYQSSIAMIALVVATAATWVMGQGLRVRRGAAAVAIVALGLLCYLTWQQCHTYESKEALWRHNIAVNPAAWAAQNNLGLILAVQGQYDEAIEHYRRALTFNPRDYRAHDNIGAALRAEGKYSEALVAHRRALKLRPNFTEAHMGAGMAYRALGRDEEAQRAFAQVLKAKPAYHAAHAQLGALELERGNIDQAVAHLQLSIRLYPEDWAAHNNLGLAMQARNDLQSAIRSFREALRLKPEYAQAHANLGNLLFRQQRTEVALRHLQLAVRSDPDLLGALTNLAAAWNAIPTTSAEQRAEAVKVADRAAQLSRGNDARVLIIQADAYAAVNRLPEAIAIGEKAQGLADKQRLQTLAGLIQQKLAGYRQRAE